MKKRLIGLFLVLACLCVGVNIVGAQDSFNCWQEDNGSMSCSSANAAYEAGRRVGRADGRRGYNKNVQGKPYAPSPVPSMYRNFASDWKSGYIIGWYEGDAERKADK